MNDPTWVDLDVVKVSDFGLPIEIRVKQGMALLDEKLSPEWVWRIDVDRLVMSDPCQCVLGQLYDDGYNAASTALFGNVNVEHDHGFLPGRALWTAVTAAWKHAILARRLELAS